MILKNAVNSVETNKIDDTEQSQDGNVLVCVTTTGNLNSKEHGDNTGSDQRDLSEWDGATNLVEDIVWSACIDKDAEFGRNDQASIE